MNNTAAVLRQIRKMCHEADSCSDCKLYSVYCNFSPVQWDDNEIKEMADAIDNYEEDDYVDQT